MKKAINEELWRILSRRAKDAFQSWKRVDLKSSNKSDYLLFKSITSSTATTRLKEAFEELNLKYRS